jgi:dolichyl-diphosphooligosaccharide--protein glycosyltransferase
MTKIGASFRNLRDRIRVAVNVKAENIIFFLALFLVVALAVMIRLTPILRPPLLIKAFDPWIQYYNAKYISEHSLYEYFTWVDEKSWYPEGRRRANLRPGLPFTAVVIFLILRFFGVPITIYEVCYFFPAFMGGLTVLAAYFLGKEVYNRSCGLFTAFFLAFNTGHMQRTMAGFFDNETIGVFATLMTLLFFLKTIKTGKFTHGIIGGVFLGYLTLSWGGYQFLLYILPIITIILILLNKYNENLLIAYTGVQGTGLLIFSLYFSFIRDDFFTDPSLGGVFLFSIIILFFHLLHSNRKDYPRFYTIFMNTIKWIALPVILTIAIVLWTEPDWIPLGLSGRLKSVLSPLMRDDLHIVASVAEHMPSAWSVFYYNTLIPLMLLPLGIFFCFKRLKAADILMMVFLLTLFYFTGSMIRIILLFAPAASLMGAYGLVNILRIFGSFRAQKSFVPSRKRRRQLKKTVGNSEVFAVYFLVGFLCLAQVLHATDISIEQLSYSQMVIGGEYHDWEETLSWMKNNIDGTDVVVSWWDYGYWLTPVGNVTTVNDNDTSNDRRIGLVGMALMQTNEIYSAEILRELEADYVLVYFGFLIPGFGGDEGKWPWMLRICNDHYEYYKDEGFEKDNWADDSVFLEDEYINETSGLYEDKWFDSQLVRLMFGYEETSPSGIDPNEDYPRWYYASQINGNPSAGISAREDDDGDEWDDHIPSNGQYDFKVFKPAYFSEHGLVKLYKVDYTALDSSFTINEPKVLDIGASTFSLKNTGIKDLEIKKVEVNGKAYNFTSGNIENKLAVNDEIPIWVELNKSFQIDDAVSISVTAESTALEGQPFTFTESTKTFFVTEAEPGDIEIIKKNSRVIYDKISSSNDVYLEVENTGNKIENIESVYFNSEDNRINKTDIEYLSGASVIKPGDKCTLYLQNAPADFYTGNGLKGNLIGVKTSSGVKDELLFSHSTEGYEISILSEERTLAPENIAAGIGTYRTYIPIDMDSINTYAYYNGTIKIQVKNTGSKIFGIGSIYIAKASEVKYGNIYNLTDANYIKESNWDVTPNRFLDPGEVADISVSAQGQNFNVDDDIVITVTGVGGVSDSFTSDIGLIEALNDTIDFRTIDSVNSQRTSFIMANETGTLLIKNIGNTPLELENINLNNTVDISIPDDVNFIYGDSTGYLDVQKCALVSFEFNNQGLKVNKSDTVNVNITTKQAIQYSKIYNALENIPQLLNYYNITIDKASSTAVNDGALTLNIDNNGKTSVTLDSVYINDTYLNINEFSTPPYILSIGGSKEIILDDFENYISVDPGDKLKILVRTKEGAEAIAIITVGI